MIMTYPKSIAFEKSPFGIEINEMSGRIKNTMRKIYYNLEGLL